MTVRQAAASRGSGRPSSLAPVPFARGLLARSLLALAALFSAVLPFGTGSALALPLDREVWHQLESENFVLVTGVDLEQSRALLDQLEGLRSALERHTRLAVASPVPVRIYVFPNDRAFQPYKHLYHGAPAAMSGAYYPSAHLDVITLHGALRSEARLTVLHEYVHVVLRNNLPGLPLWLEEGLAELFSTFEPAREVAPNGGRIGRAVPWHVRALAKAADLPLVELLGVAPGSHRYQRFEDQSLFYARAWELSHFLLLGDRERRGRALRYLALGARGVDPEAAFVRAFDTTPEELERELVAHRRRGFASQPLPATATGPGATASASRQPIAVLELSHGALLARLGDLLLAQGDREDDARFHFEQALERALRPPSSGRGASPGALRVGPGERVGEPGPSFAAPDLQAASAALVGSGAVAERAGDLARARAFYRRAWSTNQQDARAHHRYGASLLWLGRAASAEKLAEARFHLETSLEIEPTFAPAWDALWQLERLAGPAGSSPRESRSGRVPLPSAFYADGAPPEDALLALALLYARQGRGAELDRLLDEVEALAQTPRSARLSTAIDDLRAHRQWRARSGPVPDHDLFR